MATIKIEKLMSALQYRTRAQSGAYKLLIDPKSSGNGPGIGKSKMELGTPGEVIAERDVGIRLDHELPVRQQRELCVAEKPNPEPQLRFGMHYQEHGKCAIQLVSSAQ